LTCAQETLKSTTGGKIIAFVPAPSSSIVHADAVHTATAQASIVINLFVIVVPPGSLAKAARTLFHHAREARRALAKAP
jgi:hypothetical protein